MKILVSFRVTVLLFIDGDYRFIDGLCYAIVTLLMSSDVKAVCDSEILRATLLMDRHARIARRAHKSI